MFRIGIVGSRRRNTQADKELIRLALLKLIDKGFVKEIVSGGCPKGADRFAEELARELNISVRIFYPDKSSLKSDTRWEYARICYERNTLIAENSDILIAVVAEDRKGGTEDTLKKFLRKSKRVILL